MTSQDREDTATTIKPDESQENIHFPLLTQLALVVLVPLAIVFLQKLIASAQLDDTINPNPSSNATANMHGRSSANHHRRRIQHAITGLSFYFLSYIIPRSLCTTLLSASTLLLYILNLARSLSPTIQSHYLAQFGPLLRNHELIPGVLPGAFWFVAGITVTSLLIPDLNVARVGVLCLAFGDPVAASVGLCFPGSSLAFEVSCWGGIRLVGRRRRQTGRRQIRKRKRRRTIDVKEDKCAVGDEVSGKRGARKSLAGCVSCFLTSFVLAHVSSPSWYNGEEGWGWDASLVAACTTTVLEGLISSFIGVDDNFLIPIGTSLALFSYNSR